MLGPDMPQIAAKVQPGRGPAGLSSPLAGVGRQGDAGPYSCRAIRHWTIFFQRKWARKFEFSCPNFL
jgi:hypothetical protein